MSLRRLNPYIILNGTASEAIKLYQSALGARAENIMRFRDMQGATIPPEQHDWVMHAMLRVGESDSVLMLSDTTPDRAVSMGGNVEIALDYSDLAEMEKAFAAMSAGGKVGVPIQDMFWGAKFGALTDAYGVKWMFNCENKKA